MRCTQAKKLVSEYVDGTLDERRAAELERHLDSCEDCRELLRDFQGIVREARDMKTVTPPDTAWEKISGALAGPRLEEPSGRAFGHERPVRAFFLSRHPLWSAAAAALVLIVGGLALIQPWRASLPLGPASADKYTLAKLDEAKGFYRQAIKALGEAAAAQQGSLDPKLASAFDKNLALVDSSIEACQRAVRRDPGNLDNQSFLLAAYQDKVELLTSLVAVKKEAKSNRGLKTAL
jgi:tetratricopeptide (TPR) repeat protein